MGRRRGQQGPVPGSARALDPFRGAKSKFRKYEFREEPVVQGRKAIVRIKVANSRWTPVLIKLFKGKDMVVAKRLLGHIRNEKIMAGKDVLVRATIASLKKSGKPAGRAKVESVLNTLIKSGILAYSRHGFESGAQKK